MKKLTLKQITEKIKEIDFPKFDLIIAIERDGIMPASLLKHFLNIPVKVIWLNYRDENNKPIKKEPILTKPLDKELKTIKNNFKIRNKYINLQYVLLLNFSVF